MAQVRILAAERPVGRVRRVLRRHRTERAMDQRTFDGMVAELTARGTRMNGLVVSGPDGVFRHDATGRGFPVTGIRSISKVVVSLAVGAAIAEGVTLRGERLSLDLEIWPFFPEFGGRRHLRDVRLRHLLTNTMGYDEGFLFREDLQGHDLDSLLPYAFSRDLVHPPGSHFAYSNVGWFLLSVIIRDALGVSLRQWAAQHVLGELGITDLAWARYGRYEAGGTGLSLSAPDVHKIGELLLGHGRYGGREVVPRGWIEAMRSPAVEASSEYDPPLRAHAYGLGLWVGDDGVHYCDGAGGQFLIVAPATRTVVVALAQAGDTLTVARCLRALI